MRLRIQRVIRRFIMLKCGFSRVCITPPMGVPIAGGYKPKYATHVLDDLFARAIAFSDGETRAVIISVDVCYLSNEINDECRTRIANECGIDRDAIMITCTHTHAGPSLGPNSWKSDFDSASYEARFKDKVCAAAKEAFSSLVPSKFYTARGETKNIAFIRRYRMKDGSIVTNPGMHNPDIEECLGTPNETVKLLRIVREGARDLYVVNYGIHACTVGGYGISADFPGVLCSTLERAIGDIDCVFLCSAQGDVNHINVHASKEVEQLSKTDIATDSKDKLRATYVARSIAGEVLRISLLANEIDSSKVKFGMREISVPANKDGGDYEEALKIHELHKAGRASELPYKDMALTTVIANANRIVRMKSAPDTFKYKLFTILVGELAFVGLPGEIFTEIGNRICEASPFSETVLCVLTNSMTTYFPTSEALRLGGYEAVTSNVGIGTDDAIVNGTSELLRRIKG